MINNKRTKKCSCLVKHQPPTHSSQDAQTNNELFALEQRKNQRPKGKGKKDNEEERISMCLPHYCPLYPSTICLCTSDRDHPIILVGGRNSLFSVIYFLNVLCRNLLQSSATVKKKKTMIMNPQFLVPTLFIYAPWVYRLLEMIFFSTCSV